MRKKIDSDTLINIAQAQGVQMSKEAATLILEYLEGHDYCLYSDEQGHIFRDDLQMEEMPDEGSLEDYSLREAVFFVIDMNEALCAEDPEPEYKKQLLHDSDILHELQKYFTGKEMKMEGAIHYYEGDISAGQIQKAEKCLLDNGIDPDEVCTVLQALGYILLDVELYPEDC